MGGGEGGFGGGFYFGDGGVEGVFVDVGEKDGGAAGEERCDCCEGDARGGAGDGDDFAC